MGTAWRGAKHKDGNCSWSFGICLFVFVLFVIVCWRPAKHAKNRSTHPAPSWMCLSLLSPPPHTPSMPCRWSWQRDVSNRRCSVCLFPSLLSDTLLIKRYLRLTSVVWRLGLFSWTSTVCDDDSREKEPEIERERERERETAYAIQSRELRHWLKCIYSIALRKLGPLRPIKYEWMRVQFAFHDEYDEYCVNCSLEFIIKFVFPANCNAVK